MLGQEIEIGLGRAFDSPSRRAARAHRVDRLSDVVGGAARIVVAVHEADDALLLVVLQHRVPGRRQDPEHEQSTHERRSAEDREVRPARAGEEEHACKGGRIDHGGSQVRLDEDEEDRPGREADGGEHGFAVPDPLRPVRQQAC